MARAEIRGFRPFRFVVIAGRVWSAAVSRWHAGDRQTGAYEDGDND